MRHPQLHAALRSAGLAAARELAARVEAGDEVPFELLEHARRSRSRGGPTLYSYRPMVGLYVERHAAELAALPAVAEAVHTMVAAWGVEAYLEARGVARPPADPHDRAALAVRQFLERLFEDAPEFLIRDEHFDRAFAELDAVLTADATETVVAIPLVGVEPAMATVAITRGVALQRPEALRGEVPDAALAGPDGSLADAVATLRWAARPGSAETPRRAREAARRLVTALRLHFPGASASAGPLVWLRTAGGPWRAMALGGTFGARGVVPLDVEDVPDLQSFVDLVARRLPEQGEVAWALRRWTLALDRDRPEESLSDLLLAGRALLEPEGPRSGRLAGRLAALCATGDERTRLARRLARLSLQEQEVIAGSRRLDRDLPERIDELAECLRAVLRDSVCGHLRGDLVEIAEQILDGVIDTSDELERDWDRERASREHPAVVGWPAEERGGTGRIDPVAYDEPRTAEPTVYAESAYDEPRTAEPAYAESAYDEPGYDESAEYEVPASAPVVDEESTFEDEIPEPAPRVTGPSGRIPREGPTALDGAAARHDLETDREQEPRTMAVPPRGSGATRDDRGQRATGREGTLPPPIRDPTEPVPLPPALVPFDPTGEIDIARLSSVDRRELWLDVTWDEPQLQDTSDDDDATGPWPVAGAG